MNKINHNSKNKNQNNRKIDFSFISAYSASFIKIRSFFFKGGGGCISLLRTGPKYLLKVNEKSIKYLVSRGFKHSPPDPRSSSPFKAWWFSRGTGWQQVTNFPFFFGQNARKVLNFWTFLKAVKNFLTNLFFCDSKHLQSFLFIITIFLSLLGFVNV